MIIWRGYGFLVVVFAFGCALSTELTVGSSVYDAKGWPKAAAMFVAAVLSWFVGRRLNRQPGRAMIDKATGQEVVMRTTHSLFFIRMEYWAFIFVAAGIYFLVAA